MDPDETLRRLLDLSQELVESGDDEAQEMAEAFLSLHEWIVNDGFLPKVWKSKRRG